MTAIRLGSYLVGAGFVESAAFRIFGEARSLPHNLPFLDLQFYRDSDRRELTGRVDPICSSILLVKGRYKNRRGAEEECGTQRWVYRRCATLGITKWI